MTRELRTAWKMKAVPERRSLKLTLAVDTTAPAVVRAIEEAAAKHGIVLTREATGSAEAS